MTQPEIIYVLPWEGEYKWAFYEKPPTKCFKYKLVEEDDDR